MAEALKASNDENRRLREPSSSHSTAHLWELLVLGFAVLWGLPLYVRCLPNTTPTPMVTNLPVVTPPLVPDIDRCNRMWTLVHGGDDIHVEDGTGEIVVEFEYLTRILEVPSDMERLSGRQMRRVLNLAQELVDVHNQDVE